MLVLLVEELALIQDANNIVHVSNTIDLIYIVTTQACDLPIVSIFFDELQSFTISAKQVNATFWVLITEDNLKVW
jgi:hypothetical protein